VFLRVARGGSAPYLVIPTNRSAASEALPGSQKVYVILAKHWGSQGHVGECQESGQCEVRRMHQRPKVGRSDLETCSVMREEVARRRAIAVVDT
jgi:hypothetical protein